MEGHPSAALVRRIPSATLDGHLASVLSAVSTLVHDGNATTSTNATSMQHHHHDRKLDAQTRRERSRHERSRQERRRDEHTATAQSGDRTTIVILSDRFDAVVVAIGSLFRYSSDSDIDIWLIGDLERGAEGNMTLLERLETALQPQAPKQTISVMSIDEATSLLEEDGVSPLWKWPQFGSQGADQDQDHQPKCVLHPEPWDYDNMHHDPFNMLRFYLPYLRPFRALKTLFFADDDIVVQKDIKTLEMYMGEGTVIAATCNGWIWSEGCMRNEPYFNAANWLDYPVSYLGKDLAHNYSGCTLSASESGHRICQSNEFGETIANWSVAFRGYAFDVEAQPRWNFGMSRFNLTEWRAQGMTEVFDNYMRANYEAKVVPETSLCFGLGIAYFAFADKVKCWNDLVGDPAFVDGLGYISKADLRANQIDASKLLGDATVLHWSGRNKPFDPTSEMDPEIYKPFDDVWEWLQEENGIRPFGRQMIDDSQEAVRSMLYADPGSGSDWFLELLDETPDVCAAGSTGNPTAAFSRESFIPPHYEDIQDNIPVCAQKRACLWSFITQNVPRYVQQYDTLCPVGPTPPPSSSPPPPAQSPPPPAQSPPPPAQPTVPAQPTIPAQPQLPLEIPCMSTKHNDSSVAKCLPSCGHDSADHAGCNRCDCMACGPDICPTPPASPPGNNADDADEIMCVSHFHNDSTVAKCLPQCGTSGFHAGHYHGCHRCDCKACGEDVCPENFIAPFWLHQNSSVAAPSSPVYPSSPDYHSVAMQRSGQVRSQSMDSAEVGSGTGAVEDELHEMHGETLCSWASRLRSDYPDRTDYADAGGVQTLWDLYEQNVFSMKTDLIPCTQSCGLKTARMFKFMRGWAQPLMNATSPAHWFQHDNQYQGPKYFVGDFSGEHCDSEGFPDARCNGSEPFLPKINWGEYKIVEMTRWNLLDRCLMSSPFAKGITEDPTDDVDAEDASITKGDVTMDSVLQCIEYSSAQRDADKLRSEVFAGEKANDWLTLYYETCAMPSQTQACVDAAVAHVTRTTRSLDAVEMIGVDSKSTMLDESSRRRWRRTSAHPLEGRRRWHPSAQHMQTLAAQWSTHVQWESAASTEFVNGVLVQGSNPTAVDEVVSTPGANVNISTEAELFPKPSSNATEDVKVIVTVDNITKSVGPNKNITTSITNTTVVVVPHGYGFHGVTHRSIRHGTLLELAAADAEHASKARTTRWIGISNAEQLSAGLIHAGFATFLQPIYCFAFPEHTEGEVIAKYLALLPEQYIVPGSNAFGGFDAQVFEASFTEAVDSRTHSLMAFGSFGDVSWVNTVRAATKRPLVLLGTIRDPVAHRVNLFYSDDALRTMAARASPVLKKGMLLSWIHSEEYPREAQLQQFYELNATLRDLSIDQVWNARNSSAVASGVDADGTASLASVYLGPVGDQQNVRRTLCVFAHSTALPIPWTRYQSDTESPSSTVPSEHLANVDEDVFDAMIVQEQREYFYVARALDTFEAFAEMYGCLAEPTEEAMRPSVLGAGPPEVGASSNDMGDTLGDLSSGDASSGGASEPAMPSVHYTGTVPADFPVFYFHHVPKSGGTTLSDYLELLPEKYIVPGSQRSERFDEDIFRKAEDEVAGRLNVLIGYSHMNARTFSEIIIDSKLEEREIKIIFLMRETLPHRVSFFHEMVGPDAHDSDQESLDMGKTVHRPYPDITSWYMKDDDRENSNMTWLVNISALTADTETLATIECLKGGLCRAPEMRSNQLLALYKLNQPWSNVGIHDMFEQVHATEPLESCSRWNRTAFTDNEGSVVQPLFKYCPNATAKVSIGIIGHLSMMRETLCLINRKLGLPVGWDGVTKKSMNWRFKKLRPMDSESSFNSSTAFEILTRETREVVFTSMLQAHLMEEAIAYGCVPPTPPAEAPPPSQLLPSSEVVWQPEWQASTSTEYTCDATPTEGHLVSSRALSSRQALASATDLWEAKDAAESAMSEARDRLESLSAATNAAIDAINGTAEQKVVLEAMVAEQHARAALDAELDALKRELTTLQDLSSGAGPASEDFTSGVDPTPQVDPAPEDPASGVDLTPAPEDVTSGVDPSSGDVTSGADPGSGEDLAQAALLSVCNPETCLVMPTGCELRAECQGCGSLCFGSSSADLAAWSTSEMAAGLSVFGKDLVGNVKPENRSLWRSVNMIVRWSVFEPSPDEYDWTAFDSLLLDVAETRVPFGVGITFEAGPLHYPQWLFDAPFYVTKYAEICGERDGDTDACAHVEYAIPNFHDGTYLARYKRVHEALAAKLHDLHEINPDVKLLYMQMSIGANHLKNVPIWFNPNRTKADYIWSNDGQPTPPDAPWEKCGGCAFDDDAPPRNVSLDPLWCPSGSTDTGLYIQWRPAYEEYARDLTAFMYDNVYKLLREEAGLRLMVTKQAPATFARVVGTSASTNAVQSKETLEEVQLFPNDWLDSHAPSAWLMRDQEGVGYGMPGERTRIAQSILNIFELKETGPVRARAELDNFWCWTGEEGNRGRINEAYIEGNPVAPSCLLQDWHFYAMTMWMLTIRMDYWNIPLWDAKEQLMGGAFTGVWRFLNRYSGVRWGGQSPGAWIGFREGLDVLDVDRFPEPQYGVLPAMDSREAHSNESKALLVDRQRAICTSLESFGCLFEMDAATEEGQLALKYGNGTNDVNVDIWRSDYGMFMQRMDDIGSVGYWWQGPEDQVFGRYARGFAYPQATIELWLDQGLWGGLPLATMRNLTLRIVFFDNAVGQFYVGYDALDGARGWAVNTTGTLRWREIVRFITDGRFARSAGSGPNGADVWLRDMSSCREFTAIDCVEKPTLFDSVEVVALDANESALINGTAEEYDAELSSLTPPELLTIVMASPPPPPKPPPPPAPCELWCESIPVDWEEKCRTVWPCSGCAPCITPSPPPPQPPPVPTEPVDVAEMACLPIPEGKKLAVAGVWVDLSSSDTSNTTDFDAETTVCEFTLSLVTARTALTADKCFTEDQVEILVLTDPTTLPANTRAMYEDAGFIIKDVAQSSAMQQYHSWLQQNVPPDEVTKLFVHTLKLAPMWDTDYAAVVVTDTDQFIKDARYHSADIFNMLLDPEKPDLIYTSDTTSPMNAGFIAVHPRDEMLDLFLQAIANGHNVRDGWGGTYDPALLEKISAISHNYVASLAATGHTAFLGQYATDCVQGAPWCFIGHDQDQGLIVHMLASVDADGNLILSSVDFLVDDELSKQIHVRHFANTPKPYDVDGVAEESENGAVSSELHKRLMSFWVEYVAHWHNAFENSPPVCNEIYACRYQKTLLLDSTLASDNTDINTDGTGMAADRQAMLGGVDASTCDALVPSGLSGGDDDDTSTSHPAPAQPEGASAPSSPDAFSVQKLTEKATKRRARRRRLFGRRKSARLATLPLTP